MFGKIDFGSSFNGNFRSQYKWHDSNLSSAPGIQIKMSEPVLNTNLLNEGGRERKRAYTGHSCYNIFPPSHASSGPQNGGEPARTTGPLARQRKTHATFSPGLRGQGGDPWDTRKAPLPATARASPLGINLFRGLQGDQAEGGSSVALVCRTWCSCGLPGGAALEGGLSRIFPGSLPKAGCRVGAPSPCLRPRAHPHVLLDGAQVRGAHLAG